MKDGTNIVIVTKKVTTDEFLELEEALHQIIKNKYTILIDEDLRTDDLDLPTAIVTLVDESFGRTANEVLININIERKTKYKENN